MDLVVVDLIVKHMAMEQQIKVMRVKQHQVMEMVVAVVPVLLELQVTVLQYQVMVEQVFKF